MSKCSSAAVAVTVSLLSAPAFATDDRQAVPDVILVTSGPLGVTADELVGSNDVVTREELEDHLDGSLADTIAHEPGVSTTYFGPAASRPVIRGLGADRVRVLVNGVGLIDASTASPDHAVASEALEARRIEILRGPAAIAYGGGAIGGVINIIDGRIPEEAAESGFEGRFYGGLTTVDEGETAAGRVRFDWGPAVFQFEAMTRNAGDYSIPGPTESSIFHQTELAEEDDHDDDHEDEEEEAYGIVENSDLQFETASFGGSLVGEWGFVGASIKRTEALYGIPGGHAHAEEEEDHDDEHEDEGHGDEETGTQIAMDQTRYDLRGEWRYTEGVLQRLKMSFGTGDYRHEEIEGGEIGTVFLNSGWESRVEARFAPAQIFGGEFVSAAGVQAFSRDFAAIGDEAYVPPSLTEDTGLFFVDRWDADNWGLEGGIRIEHRTLETAMSSLDFDTHSVSGSLFFRPTDNMFLALTLASNERAPTDVELFADGPHLATGSYEIGDSALRVEQAQSIELTLRTDIRSWTVEGALFRASYDGFISSFPTGAEIDGLPVFAYRQDDVTLSGFEGRAEGPLGRLGAWDIGGEFTAEYVSSDLERGGHLAQMPPLSISLGIEAQTPRHTLHIDLDWSDVQNETADLELKTAGHVLVGAGWTIEPFDDRHIRLLLQGRNLTNADARLHTSVLKETVPLPGRSFRAALVLEF
jgi:iron complex outermembrane receptor protein